MHNFIYIVSIVLIQAFKRIGFVLFFMKNAVVLFIILTYFED